MVSMEELAAYLRMMCGAEVSDIRGHPDYVSHGCSFCGFKDGLLGAASVEDHMDIVFCQDLGACQKREAEKAAAKKKFQADWLAGVKLPE